MRRRHADSTVVPEDIREARYRMLLSAAARVSAAVNGAARARPSTSREDAQAS
jgi:hypothetical protein